MPPFVQATAGDIVYVRPYFEMPVTTHNIVSVIFTEDLKFRLHLMLPEVLIVNRTANWTVCMK